MRRLDIGAREAGWIKTKELNQFSWIEGQIPLGMTPVKQGQWSYGFIPPDTYVKMRESIEQNIQERRAALTKREEVVPPSSPQPKHNIDLDRLKSAAKENLSRNEKQNIDQNEDL